MFPKPGEDPNPVCTKCSGDQKNAPSLGLVIIKGMQRNGLIYENGTILDPRNGQVYQAKNGGEPVMARAHLCAPSLAIGVIRPGPGVVPLPTDVLPADEMPAKTWCAVLERTTETA